MASKLLLTYTWNVVVGTRAVWEKPIANFPGENGRTFAFVLANLSHDLGRGHPRFRAPDGPRLYRARFVVAPEDLGHAAVGDLKDAGNITRSGARMRQLDDALARRVRQRPAVHVDAAQLIHAAVTCNRRGVWGSTN